MIQLGSDEATIVAGVLVVTAASWASFVSIRSAAAGPSWTLSHLRRSRWVALASSGLGMSSILVLRPMWLSLIALYVPLAVTALMWLMGRSLERLDRMGGLEPLAEGATSSIVARARRAMVISGGGLVGLGGIGLVVGIDRVPWIVAVVGITMTINGLFIRGAGRPALAEPHS